jgi:hypothetical protein
MLRQRFDVLVQRLVQRNVALATVAATTAPFANVHPAGIFGAERANPRGFLLTDTTRKRH